MPKAKTTKPKVISEDKAYKQLLYSTLVHNGYYEYLCEWAKKKKYSLSKVASMLNIVWDKVPDGMSHFYYLDSIEDMLCDLVEERDWKEILEMFDDGYDFIDYLYDNDLWKSIY